MKQVDFHIDGDAARAKATAVQALESRKFKLKWASEWAGTAEKGNVIANALLGALAQYFKFGLSIMTAPEGHGVVRIEKQTSGWLGGALGARRVSKNFEGLKVELEQTFAAAGVLRNVDVVG